MRASTFADRDDRLAAHGARHVDRTIEAYAQSDERRRVDDRLRGPVIGLHRTARAVDALTGRGDGVFLDLH